MIVAFGSENRSGVVPEVALSFSASDSPKALRLSQLEQVQILRRGRISEAAFQERLYRKKLIEKHNQYHKKIPLRLSSQSNLSRTITFERDISSPNELPDSGMEPVLQLDIQMIPRSPSAPQSTFWTNIHHLPKGEPVTSFQILDTADPEPDETDSVLHRKYSVRVLYQQDEEWPHFPAEEETIKIKDFWINN